MTAHAQTPAHDVGHVAGADPRIEIAKSLKLEPSELHDFEVADKAAGQMLGKLLAALFCVLLTLMTGVNLWMTKNAAKGTDPQAPITVDADHNSDASNH